MAETPKAQANSTRQAFSAESANVSKALQEGHELFKEINTSDVLLSPQPEADEQAINSQETPKAQANSTRQAFSAESANVSKALQEGHELFKEINTSDVLLSPQPEADKQAINSQETPKVKENSIRQAFSAEKAVNVQQSDEPEMPKVQERDPRFRADASLDEIASIYTPSKGTGRKE